MEIQQLRHLLAAAECSSYAEAARRCFTSRQNIAHSIRALENELGVLLFERRHNGVVLTPAGQQVLNRANEIVEGVDGLSAIFTPSSETAQALKLAVSFNLFAGVSPATDAFLVECPERFHIRELSCQECYESVCDGRADVAVIMSMKRAFSGCNAFEIASSQSYALAGQQSYLSRIRSLSVLDLRTQELLLMSPPAFQYEPLFEQLDCLAYNRENASVIVSTSSAIHIAKRSNAVALVSTRFASYPPEGTIVIPLAAPEFRWHFYILYKMNASNSRLIIKLAENIRATFKDDEQFS